MRLLNPGPVTLSERVRRALLRPDLCHREPEFAELQARLRRGLEQVYGGSDHAAVLLTGSGTAAVEAMLGSLVDRSALVVANGVYGERMAAILDRQGKPCEVVRSAWTEPLDLAAVEARLERQRPGHVVAVHHETTTGRLNDLPGLGALCRRSGVPLLLDAVSSFGGAAIDLEAWNVEACAATANKCLHGVPGISFVLARRPALARRSASPSLYLDLMTHFREQERGSTPFTQAVHACHALDEALAEFAEAGGWRARAALYARRSALVARCGLAPYLPEGSSDILRAYRLPEPYGALHDRLKAAGFVIYAGQGDLQGEMFRVAVMGDLPEEELVRLAGLLRPPEELPRGGRKPAGAPDPR